ncbi:MAG: PilN domain-containing protein [Desulfobacteraceae bacterium]|jgi:type IV pilus assembly protein PilN
MIRINLLPFRAARKKENIRRQLTIFALTVVFALVVMAYYFMKLSTTLSDRKKQEQQIKVELAGYKKTIERINNLEKKIAEIRKKLDVIKDLEKKKTGPVLLLDQIATAVPKEKLWLTSLVEKKGKLTVNGTAMDNETVAVFMTNLENSELITAVDLKSTRLRSLPKYKLSVSDFSLECTTYAFKEETKAKGKGRRRR